VSVPFKDAAELEAGGTAAFLRVLPGSHEHERRGALFQVNARGAPVEFTFNRVDLPPVALWRPEELEREAVKALARSLFEAARRTPLVLLCLSAELDAGLFTEELEVQIPVCRVGIDTDDAHPSPLAGEVARQGRMGVFSGDPEPAEQVVSGGRQAHLFWRPALPSAESPPRRLVAGLASRGLLLEPFERVLAGLEEAFGDEPSPA
jgi:hypothetical protein